METLAPILTVIASIATSSVAAAFVSFHLNNSKDRKLLLRNKIEEIYINYRRFANSLSTYYLCFMPVMRGQYDYNEALDLFNNAAKSKPNNPFEPLEMNINIYFPELLDDLNHLIALRDNGNDILLSFKKAYINQEPNGLHYHKLMLNLINDVDIAEKQFYRKLTKMALELNSVQPFLKSISIFRKLKIFRKL
ncbi:MAG TPA: hypothetical protein PKC79_04355 [Solidesulfovibrio magneticus]|nr:hypothetical protein [Solidesulfovibrio magneticus]